MGIHESSDLPPLPMAEALPLSSPIASAEALVTLTNEAGLHLRVAMRIVEIARELPVEIVLVTAEGRANATSMLELFGLCALPGTSLRLVASGADPLVSLRKFVGSLSPEEFRIEAVPAG